jgi:RNA polymerase sigma-70 factor (ECF subfamily)
MDITDEARSLLLQRCASGDSAALRTLYEQVAPQLFSVLLRILHRTDLAEEALQEVFMSVWRNASSYRPGRGSPMAWLTSIARYRALDIRRSLKADQYSGDLMEIVAETVAAEGTDLVEKASLSADAQRLEDCMGRLNPQQNKAIRLAFVEGLTHEEVAVKIGSPVGTIKSWVRRGLQALRSCLGS